MLTARHERTQHHARVGWIPVRERADCSGERFDDFVVAVVRNEDAGLSATGLTGVEHSGHDEIVHDSV